MDIQDIVGLLASLDPAQITVEEFANHAALSQSIMTKIDDTQKLILYGLYKQSTVGNSPKQTAEDVDKTSPEYYKWYNTTYFIICFPKNNWLQSSEFFNV